MANFRRKRGRAERLGVLVFFGCVACTPSCSRNEAVLSGAMSGPAGLVVAGSQHDRVYVAMRGLDALQVVDAASALPQVHFVVGPARYFPLYVPVGPSPTELAASENGRYVFVLDALNGEVRVVDADAAEVLTDADGAPVRAPVGPRAARPVAMLGHPWPTCVPSEANPTQDCLGRAYVVLEALGALAAVDVRQNHGDGHLSLRLDSTYVVGGAPRSLAAHPTLPVLFLGDPAAGEVVRLAVADGAGGRLRRGAAQRTLVQGDVGPLVVSDDGTALAIGRPATADLTVYVATVLSDAATAAENLALGPLRQLPRPTAAAPKPACLQACGEAQSADCADAHPADASLCVAPDGYRAVPGRGYDGLWLGSAPQALVAMGPTQLGGPLQLTCHNAPEQVRAVDRAIAVASFDGAVRFVDFGAGAPFAAAGTPALLDLGFCRQPSASPLDPAAPAQPADVLAACPNVPAGDPRFATLQLAGAPADANVGTRPAQVGLWRGQGREQSFRLAWEDVLPFGNQPAGNGAIDAEGRFYDVVGGTDRLAQVPLRAAEVDRFGEASFRGDVLEVLTAPEDVSSCGTLVDGRVPSCAVERRILADERGPDGTRRLRLDAPLSASCFIGPIAYRIRAGDAFLAGPGDATAFAGTPARLGPGDAYGPGRSAGAQGAAFFRIAPNLDVGADLDACARYRRGAPAPGAPAWRSRQAVLGFVVADPYLPLQAARSASLDPASEQASGGTVGQLPYAAASMPPNAARGPLLWVTYFASGGLLAVDPRDSRTLGVGDAGRLMQ